MSVVAEEIIVSQMSSSSSQDVYKRLVGQYWRLARRQQMFARIVNCFREQPAVLPLQCSEAIAHLDALRRAVYHTHDFLVLLDPEDTRRLQPWACIDKLTMLDSLLSEAILTIAMFSPICQALLPQRVELHLRIRSLFPHLHAAYQDTLSQVTVLLVQERQEGHTHDC